MTDLLAWFGILVFLGIVGWGLVAVRFRLWKDDEDKQPRESLRRVNL